MEKKERFKQVLVEDFRDPIQDPLYDTQVIVDLVTGVQYLISRQGGICPLLDRDGKPLLHTGEE